MAGPSAFELISVRQLDALLPRLVLALLRRGAAGQEQPPAQHARSNGGGAVLSGNTTKAAAAMAAALLQLLAMRLRGASVAEAFYGFKRARRGAPTPPAAATAAATAAAAPWVLSYALQAAVLAAWPLLLDAAEAIAQRAQQERDALPLDDEGEPGGAASGPRQAPHRAAGGPGRAASAGAAAAQGEARDGAHAAPRRAQDDGDGSVEALLRSCAARLPSVVGLLEILSSAQLLMYALDVSPHPTLATRAVDVVLQRPSMADSQAERILSAQRLARDRALQRRVGMFRRVLLRAADAGAAVASALTPLAAMSVTLALSVAARPSPAAPRNAELPLPPPPAHNEACKAEPAVCPRCATAQLDEAVVLPSAGVVACHRCWVAMLDDNRGHCPYTGVAATPNDLRRVRLDDNF